MIQPGLFPWYGTFAKASFADVFVHLDHVSWQRGGFLNRFALERDSRRIWATFPQKRTRLGAPIKDVILNTGPAVLRGNLDRIRFACRGEPYVRRSVSLLTAVMVGEVKNAAELAINSTELICREVGIKSEFVRSSTLGLHGRGTEMIAEIMEHLGGEYYIFGPTRSGPEHHYLEVSLLKDRGVTPLACSYPSGRRRVSILQDIASGELGHIRSLNLTEL